MDGIDRGMDHEQRGSSAPPLLAHARTEEGKTDRTIVSVGDKGRSQLTRAEPELFKMCVADTYKQRVTFAQVGSHAGQHAEPRMRR
jgi:hypothetical protein